MIGAVIITHGGLAGSIMKTAEAITGGLEKVVPVEIRPQDSTGAVRETLVKAVKTADSGKGVLIFTDMFGGTPTNIALSLFSPGRVEILTGINLPLLLKFISHRSDRALAELTAYLKDYGRDSIVTAGEMLKEKQDHAKSREG